MEISGIIRKDSIFLGLEAPDRETVINRMIDGLAAGGYVSDRELYHAAVEERESKGSTGIGFGVAIPHGKSEGVATPCIAFARLKTPVEWKSFDGAPVTAVFMIGVPAQNAGNDHLRILIAISKQLMHEEFRDALAKAQTPEEILTVLQSIEA